MPLTNRLAPSQTNSIVAKICASMGLCVILFSVMINRMKNAAHILRLSLMLIAFAAKAFVPTGMMLDVQSFMRGGDLITICPSVGELPWMTAYIDHSGHEMVGIDENASERCPYAALDVPADTHSPAVQTTCIKQQFSIIAVYIHQTENTVLKRAARAPPQCLNNA